MHNWSVDLKELKKDKKSYMIWRLEQLINFGLNGQKIRKQQLIKYWSYLHLDPIKKRYLFKLLWPNKIWRKSINTYIKQANDIVPDIF